MPIPFLGKATVDEPKAHYGRVSTFNHVNGYSVPKVQVTVPDTEYTEQQVKELNDSALRATYGTKLGHKAPPQGFVPNFVHLDKKVLYFQAFMKQTVHESSVERFRVRYFRVFYYLEDDTMSITEPEIENSGMVHGTFLSRQRLPGPDGQAYHWTKLNVGQNITVYGKVMRLYDTNESTKTFLEQEGIEVGTPESAPEDSYRTTRMEVDRPQVTHETPNDFDKLKQFLVLDRKVLRFYATWEDPSSPGARLKAEVFYFLVDDSVEVREIHTANNGRDPFPVLLRRQRVPANHLDVPMDFASSILEISAQEVGEYITPAHFAIGKEVGIFGRTFFIYDMDAFTREFYTANFGVETFDPIDVDGAPAAKPQPELPPYTGIGTPEDSYLSCVSINPKAPSGQKSLLQLLKYDNAVLRFEAVLDSVLHPDEGDRKFILSLRLADNYVSVYEPPVQNSGIQGGTILAYQRVAHSDSNPDMPTYLGAKDFYVGAQVTIFKRTYNVTDLDAAVVKYMKVNSKDYSAEALKASGVTDE